MLVRRTPGKKEKLVLTVTKETREAWEKMQAGLAKNGMELDVDNAILRIVSATEKLLRKNGEEKVIHAEE